MSSELDICTGLSVAGIWQAWTKALLGYHGTNQSAGLCCQLVYNRLSGLKHYLNSRHHCKWILYNFVILVTTVVDFISYKPSLRSARKLTHDHPGGEGISMPHARFGPDPLKTVAVHKEQRN